MKHERFDSFMERHAEIPFENMTRYEHKLENTFLQIREKQTENNRKLFRYGRMTVIAAVCALMLILIPPLLEDYLLINRQRAYTEDDGEVYILNGVVSKPDTGEKANAEDDTDDSDQVKQINTESYEEFCAFIGSELDMPAVFLEEWEGELYYASKESTRLYIDVYYVNGDAHVSYSRWTYYDGVIYSSSINQDEEGITVWIDGVEVYVYSNRGQYTAVWSTGKEDHMLGGEVSRDELMKLLEEFI